MDISTARVAVAAANPSLAMSEVEEVARRLVSHEEIEQMKSHARAELDISEMSRDQHRVDLRARLLGETPVDPTEPTSGELLKQLRDLGTGEGWG